MTKTDFRKALSQLGLTQGQAAKLWGYSLSSVHNFANGRQKIPPLVEYWIKAEIEKLERA